MHIYVHAFKVCFTFIVPYSEHVNLSESYMIGSGYLTVVYLLHYCMLNIILQKKYYMYNVNVCCAQMLHNATYAQWVL